MAHAPDSRRFPFGSNWKAFLDTVDEDRITRAQSSLLRYLELDTLEGMDFLDIGCGSGLFSLAARRLGARVHSFDFDKDSVSCARTLRDRFLPQDTLWNIEHGSVLDPDYIRSLGKYNIVYAWGVLHHTGDMNAAMSNAIIPLSDGGRLYIAIYNDQGVLSSAWRAVKKLYCSNLFGQGLITATFIPLLSLFGLMIGISRFGNPLGYFSQYRHNRGMSIYHDWIDWLGGYPFEVAKPEYVFLLYRGHGFTLKMLQTTNGSGCNQYVFEKTHKSTEE